MRNEEQLTNTANETYSLREDELFDVLEVARKRDARDHAILTVGYWHGLRNQEIAKLRLSDIDWAAETIRVQRQKSSMLTVQGLARRKGQPTMCEVTALKTWLKQRKSISDYVFTSRRDDSCLGQRQMNRIFKTYLALANEARLARGDKAIPMRPKKDGNSGVKWSPLSIHSLKHTAGSIAADKGSTATDIKMLLGHKSIQNSERYIHPSQRAAWERRMRLELT
jgi:integrase